MSDKLLRISEAVAVDCAHISAEVDDTSRLLMPNSKTDRTRQGAIVFLGKATMDTIAAYCQLAGIESGPCFGKGAVNRTPAP